jgi:hypothetical protein
MVDASRLINTGIPAVSSAASAGGYATPGTPPGTPAPMVHELKTWPEFFDPVFQGKKNFELRFDDRRFEVGDELHLREYVPATNQYTGREARKTISYILRSSRRLERGYVIMSFRNGSDA